MTAGEFLGFLAPAVGGALTAAAAAPVALGTLVVAAGAKEGALLGWAQARVWRQMLPRLAVRRYTAAT